MNLIGEADQSESEAVSPPCEHHPAPNQASPFDAAVSDKALAVPPRRLAMTPLQVRLLLV